jgi:dUTP pyrophosphatase
MKIRGFEPVSDSFKKHDAPIILPQRGTKTSAGYDFATPINVNIAPHQQFTVWTDVKAYMQEGEVLILDIRSSIGINKNLMLANTIGIIDSDYYSNIKNDGNIGICLYNNSNYTITLEAGERIAQGIFLPFLEADNGNTNNERVGGIGSTGKV